MLVKGTRLYEDSDAKMYRTIINLISDVCIENQYDEVILPVLADPNIWIERSGKEIEQQMWTFEDKGQRPTCLIPEATAVIQSLYNNNWSKQKKKPIRIFYNTKCFRYERPQTGRYREFTQFGLEILGPNPEQYEEETIRILNEALEKTFAFYKVDKNYELDTDVTRGLSYYSRNGFEVRVEKLGAQKQIAGGGVYKEGCGWAIGIDRLILSL